jgi:hypothetical protein
MAEEKFESWNPDKEEWSHYDARMVAKYGERWTGKVEVKKEK